MHPKIFEKTYIRVDIIVEYLNKMLLNINQLDYHHLNDYDKGGLDGYNQAVTEVLNKIEGFIQKYS